MSVKFTKYTAIENDRWDLIAYKAYGDAGKVDGIIRANPGIPAIGTIPAGAVIQIPVISIPEADVNNLPPWKR